MDNIPVTPWPPVKVRKEGNGYSILSWDRIYSLRDSVLFTSVVSHGNEILSAPMHLTGSENGMEIEWREQNAFIMEETAQKVTICASQESSAFIVNTCLETEYDGYCAIDIKIVTMPEPGTNDNENLLAQASIRFPFSLICCILYLTAPAHYRARCNIWRSRGRKIISCRHPLCTNDWGLETRVLINKPILLFKGSRMDGSQGRFLSFQPCHL